MEIGLIGQQNETCGAIRPPFVQKNHPTKLWLFAHFLPFYPHCGTSNYNQPSIAVYYGGCGGGGFGSGGGSGCNGCSGGVGGRVMVVA